MRRPSAGELLTAWESGATGSWAQRAVLLVALADPELSPAEALALSVGERDGRIFEMHRLLFGPRLDCVADCPRCGEALQTSLSSDDVLAGRGDLGHRPESLKAAGLDVLFRLPTGADLLDLGASGGSEEAERRLLGACILTATSREGPVDVDGLPDQVLEAVSARMSEIDPCADVRLALSCTVCGHAWEAPFDIVSHAWLEIEAWAHRILEEVHTLARAYGWPERDILGLSAPRRRAYLELVGA